MRILIACDKFKGTLTAEQANAAIANALPEHQVQCQAIADGGEATAETLGRALGGQQHVVQVLGPLGAPVDASFWLANTDATTAIHLPVQPGQAVAFMDMSAASGLQLLATHKRDPWRASTYGTGQLLLAATDAGAGHIFLGLGGSATNDGGAGLAIALGYQFVDAHGIAITDIPADLNRAVQILPTQPSLASITVACDVDSPLLGPTGAVAMYGAQKGVDPTHQARFEARLQHLAALVATSLGTQHAETAGSGAAGGLGFGLLSFTQAQLQPGFELLAQLLDLKSAIANADLVITGEGSLDTQSLQGKGPAALASMARDQSVPCVALCGQWDSSPALQERFAAIFSLVGNGQAPPTDSAAALAKLVADRKREILAPAA